MAQFNITITEELLNGLFLSNGKDAAFSKLLEEIFNQILMVINCVSTRKVEWITEELCGKKFSKSTISELCKNLDPMIEAFRTRPLQSHYPFLMVDAIYVKVRENGRIQSRGMLIAIGVNEEGYREIIGFQLANSESESSWGEFFSSLKDRGLKDVYNDTRN